MNMSRFFIPPLLHRGYTVRFGDFASVSVNRTSSGNWRWRVWRTEDSSMLMTGITRRRRQALDAAETFRRRYASRPSPDRSRRAQPGSRA